MDPHLFASSAFPGLTFRPVSLGDKLQLLARIAPTDVQAITLIVDDVLHQRLRLMREQALHEVS